MTRSADHQICFRLPDAAPAASPAEPLRLGDTQAEALSELLQVFACGEESAALAFAHLGGSPLEDAARRGLARVAEEELIHERLLRGLRAALPEPAPDRELRRTLLRFYHNVAQTDIGLHLASIAALDSAVCAILATLLEPGGTLTQEPEVAKVLRRIHRDEDTRRRKSEPTGNTNFDLNRRASPRPYLASPRERARSADCDRRRRRKRSIGPCRRARAPWCCI